MAAVSSPFQQHWLAESVRLREAQWGPLQDSAEVRRACIQGGGFDQRLMTRACLLGRREGLDVLIRRWAGGARLALFLMLAVAVVGGMGAAMGALGDGSRQVNLLLALTALLGLHIVSLFLWALAYALPTSEPQAGLGEFWLWLTRKLARGPQAALALRALVGMLSRRRALRSLLGGISHGWWLLALLAMLITLIALLSARRYTFAWETTLLSPLAFVRLTEILGWLPERLGFSIPPPEIIRASDGLHALPEHAHALWSSWLIGCLVCYGLAPRAIALAASLFITQRRLSSLTLDPSLPGYAELRDRLDPPSQTGDIDAPAPGHIDAGRTSHGASAAVVSALAVVGLELPGDTTWPPFPLSDTITDLGIVDTRAQRRTLLSALAAGTPRKLLIICDGEQTPDRGIIALIKELNGLALRTHVALHSDAERTGSRASLWQDRLEAAGWPADQVHTAMPDALRWLSASDDSAAQDASP